MGYSRALRRISGLSQWRPEEIVWAEPADDCRMMLRAYPDADTLRAAAALCREWGTAAGEKGQRELWARLKAEGPPGEYSAREVARVAAVQARTVNQAAVVALGGKNNGDWRPRAKASDGSIQYPDDAPAAKLEAIASDRWPRTRLYRDVREIESVADALLFLDPPYVGDEAATTKIIGYGADDLTRADMLNLCRRWHRAGSMVLCSEAVPLPLLMNEGWWVVNIGSARTGAARSGANRGCVSEWVTMNRAPAWRPGQQVELLSSRPRL